MSKSPRVVLIDTCKQRSQRTSQVHAMQRPQLCMLDSTVTAVLQYSCQAAAMALWGATLPLRDTLLL
jgi:hypothetical protein